MARSKKPEHRYPTEKQLRQGARHLDYEIEQFYKQWVLLTALHGHLRPDQLDAGGFSALDPVIRTRLGVATLEGWLVHVRGLLIAFRRNRHLNTDILFRDFLANDDWESLKTQLVPSQALEKRIDGLNVLLAHPSYRRASPKFDDIQWVRWGALEYLAVHERLARWYPALLPNRQLFGRASRLIKTPPSGLHEI